MCATVKFHYDDHLIADQSTTKTTYCHPKQPISTSWVCLFQRYLQRELIWH